MIPSLVVPTFDQQHPIRAERCRREVSHWGHTQNVPAWVYPCPTILLGLVTAKFRFFFIFHFWEFLPDTVHKFNLNNIHLRSLSNYFGERTQLQDLLCFWDFQIFMEYLGLKKSNCVYLDNCDSFSDVHLPRESWHIHGLWYYGD